MNCSGRVQTAADSDQYVTCVIATAKTIWQHRDTFTATYSGSQHVIHSVDNILVHGSTCVPRDNTSVISRMVSLPPYRVAK